jgi:hypothetical protein
MFHLSRVFIVNAAVMPAHPRLYCAWSKHIKSFDHAQYSLGWAGITAVESVYILQSCCIVGVDFTVLCGIQASFENDAWISK